MSGETTESHAARVLAGATILQAVPAMRDDRVGHTASDTTVALLRAGARALIAGGGGMLVGEVQALGGEWLEFDFPTNSILQRGRSARALGDLMSVEKIDLVHAYGVEAARAVAAALKRGGSRFVTTYPNFPPPPSWRPQPQDALARADTVIAYSAFGADLIAKRHRIPRERIAVIPTSVDTTWFDPVTIRPDRVASLRRAWRVEPRDRIVLAPGKLTAARGHLALIDAARILVNGGLHGTVFVIAGEPADGDDTGPAIDQRIEAQGLQSCFRRVGHCADMPVAYALSDLVTLPLEQAPIFSAATVEAQAMMRPVIASNIGALPELIRAPPHEPESRRTGWLARPRDPLDLARALAQALTLDADSRRAMGRRARQFAEARFSPLQTTGATLSVYAALLDETPANPAAAD